MQTSLAITAVLMGLAGGPHCIAMCGAPCAGIGHMAGASAPRQAVAIGLFQIGRVIGYATLGAVAAATMQGLGWMSTHSAALRPVWSMLHVLALLLGLWLLIWARQPRWLDRSARAAWARVQAFQQRRGMAAPVIVGIAWALLPCGLLYSALMVAALSSHVVQGAAVMVLFALGTSVWLMLGPWLLLRLGHLQRGDGSWGMRLAGLALAISAGVGLWLGLMHDQAPWCATPVIQG